MSYPPQGFHAIDDVMIITQAAEPAVPADKFRIWHDTGTAQRWLILGTDGTVPGNMKVEIKTMPAHGIHVKTVEDHPLDVIPTMDDVHIPPEIARDAEVASEIATHAGIPDAHHAKYTDAEADARADAKVATHDGLADPHAVATAIGGKTLGLDDGDVAVLPAATEN